MLAAGATGLAGVAAGCGAGVGELTGAGVLAGVGGCEEARIVGVEAGGHPQSLVSFAGALSFPPEKETASPALVL